LWKSRNWPRGVVFAGESLLFFLWTARIWSRSLATTQMVFDGAVAGIYCYRSVATFTPPRRRYEATSTNPVQARSCIRLATVQRPREFLGEAGQARTSPSPCMCLPPPRVFFRNDRFTAAGRRGIFDDLIPNVSPLMTAQLPHMSCSRQTSKHEPDNYSLDTRHETDADPVQRLPRPHLATTRPAVSLPAFRSRFDGYGGTTGSRVDQSDRQNDRLATG
jgi:hypothetical protein